MEPEQAAGVLLSHGADVNARNNSGRTLLELAQDSRHWQSDDIDEIVIRCEGCGTTYGPGTNAVCITSGEMADQIGPVAFKMGINIMIGHGKAGQSEQVLRDKELILRRGPKGWTCQECHKDNQWLPMGKVGTERWKSSGEPEAWVWKHLQGWSDRERRDLLTSVQLSKFRPIDDVEVKDIWSTCAPRSGSQLRNRLPGAHNHLLLNALQYVTQFDPHSIGKSQSAVKCQPRPRRVLGAKPRHCGTRRLTVTARGWANPNRLCT